LGKKEETTEKIINAALIEFGTKGYELASTNNIYKAAGVSKGVIFLYFNSKAELYYQVFKYSLSKLIEDMNKLDLDHIEDIFEKILAVTFWKLEYFAERPNDSKILVEAVSKPPKEIAAKIINHYDQLTVLSLSNFFNNINIEKFSDEYTREEVIKFVQIALNGIQGTYIRDNVTVEYLKSIKDECLKFLKTILKGMEK